MPGDEVDPLDAAREAAARDQANGTGAPPKKPKPAAAAHTGSDFQYKGGEAHLLWGEMLGRGINPDDIRINLRRVDPPVPGGSIASLQPIEGVAVRDGADSLYNFIANYHHLPFKQKSVAKYECTFTSRSTGQPVTRGTLTLPHQDELLASRPQVVDPYAQSPSPQPRPWSVGAPPQAGPYYPPPQQQAAPTQPQYAPPPGSDPAVQAQIAHLSGQLTQVLAHLGVQSAPAPTPLPQQQASQLSGVQELLTVVKSLRDMGLIPAAPAAPTPVLIPTAVATPVAAAPAAGPLGQLGELVAQLKALADFKDQAKGVLENLAGVPEEGDPNDPKGSAGPAGEAALPWQRVRLGSFAWALDKETGGWSPQGIVAELINAPPDSPLAKTRDTVLNLAGRVVSLAETAAKKGIPGIPQLSAGPVVGGSGSGGSSQGW